MNNDEIETIKKAINGNRQAIIKLIRQEENNIYSTLFYLKKNNDEINDLMQDVLIKLSKKIYQLKNPLYFKTWLNQIILNTYYDYLRKNKKIFKAVPDENEKNNIIDDKNNPQDRVLYTELDKVIRNSIENLPIQYRIPIVLRELQGLTYNQISNITNVSQGTVKSRISRARSIIQDKVRKYAQE